MRKTDHVDFEEREVREAVLRDVVAAIAWDKCLECGLIPEKSLALINKTIVKGGFESFESLADLRDAAAHARHTYPDLIKECCTREC